MHNSDWIALFRQLPPEIHPQLVLVLQNSTNLTVETIFRLEPTLMVIRGRLGGTTDNGMIFLIPYDQLAAIYSYKEMKEADIEALFGPAKSMSKLLSKSVLMAARSAAALSPSQAPAPGAAPAPAPAPGAMPSFGRAPEATAVARNNLLERLRAARQAAMPPANGK